MRCTSMVQHWLAEYVFIPTFLSFTIIYPYPYPHHIHIHILFYIYVPIRFCSFLLQHASPCEEVPDYSLASSHQGRLAATASTFAANAYPYPCPYLSISMYVINICTCILCMYVYCSVHVCVYYMCVFVDVSMCTCYVYMCVYMYTYLYVHICVLVLQTHANTTHPIGGIQLRRFLHRGNILSISYPKIHRRCLAR